MNNMKKLRNILLVGSILLALLVVPRLSTYKSTEVFSKQDPTIVEIASNDARFTTLVKALQQAGLVDTLNGDGAFTVFAPTDDAFKKLPEGTLDNLLKPENKDMLKDILLYHVANGNSTNKNIANLNGKEIDMTNGKKATITTKGDEVFINDAKVIVTDIMAKNGVIHVIDTVLIPK